MAPTRFSTRNCCPNASLRRCPVRRATLSMLPPAANPTRSRTGFCGQLCACAMPVALTAASAAADASSVRREIGVAILFMVSLPGRVGLAARRHVRQGAGRQSTIVAGEMLHVQCCRRRTPPTRAGAVPLYRVPMAASVAGLNRRDTHARAARDAPAPRSKAWQSGAPPAGATRSARRSPRNSRRCRRRAAPARHRSWQ